LLLMRFFALSLLVAAALAARISYSGEQILRCEYADHSVIHKLEEVVDVQGVVGEFVDVRAKTPEERELIEKVASNCQVVVEDLEVATQQFEAINFAARANATAEWFDAYHTYDEIRTWFQQLSTTYPTLVTWVNSTGTSSGGRALFAVRLFDRANAPTRQPQRRIFWTGQIHAREWIAGATVQGLTNEIIQNFQNRDPLFVGLLATTEIIVLPIVNPDGYVYTWTNDRQWRKNRRAPPTGSTCFGVDQNRNYNDHWNGGGSSNNPCSDTYMGPSAASEPEVQAVQNYFMNNQNASCPIVGAIDSHSYSQLVLRPFGWTSANSGDETVLKRIGDQYSADIRAQSGRAYTSQKSIDLYVTSGTASDWYYGTQAFTRNGGYRVASYTVELRPTGNPPGFVLPPIEIVPTGRENFAAIRTWLDTLNKNPIYRP